MERKKIADYLEWAESTVRQTIHRWNQRGLAGLWEVGGRGHSFRGKKPRWTNEDWQALEQKIHKFLNSNITSCGIILVLRRVLCMKLHTQKPPLELKIKRLAK